MTQILAVTAQWVYHIVMKKKTISRQAAKVLGLKRYYTGNQCKHGHFSDRFVADCHCVKCCKMKSRKFRQSNKEYEYDRKKKYYNGNKEELKSKRKLYMENNKEFLSTQRKKNNLKPARYKSYAKKLIGHECTKDKNGSLVTKCKKCDSWFIPTVQQVRSRVDAINGRLEYPGRENNIYCSDKCKQNCDTFNRSTLPKHLATKRKRQRCRQRTNKKSLMELQTDNHGYTFCEKCGTKTNYLEIHHSVMVADDKREIDNMAHQILLCIDCHQNPEAHCRD